MPAARRRLVQRLREDGHSQREIARRIGVSEKAVRKLLRRLGWRPVAPAQPGLGLNGPTTADPNLAGSSATGPASPPEPPVVGADPNLSTFSSTTLTKAPVSADCDPTDRGGDRLLALAAGELIQVSPRGVCARSPP
ncbi:MAG: sigma-70 region 4 domain-containing protein [Verrucomicrobiales bacterium]|nr:sigma-70 region 4 domain-containing protein [Verrucomicrobiales bacterium]